MNDLEDRLKYPLLVVEGLDLSLYYSIKALEIGLEGVDVEENAYTAFDAEGRLLHLVAIGVKRGRFGTDVGRVEVKSTEEVPNHQQELAGHLREHLRASGYPVEDDLRLEGLVRLCERVHNKSR